MLSIGIFFPFSLPRMHLLSLTAARRSTTKRIEYYHRPQSIFLQSVNHDNQTHLIRRVYSIKEVQYRRLLSMNEWMNRSMKVKTMHLLLLLSPYQLIYCPSSW